MKPQITLVSSQLIKSIRQRYITNISSLNLKAYYIVLEEDSYRFSRKHGSMCNSDAHIIFCWVSFEYAIQWWQQLTNSCLFGGLCLKVPLLAMMEEYNMLRNEKEKEKQRQRVSIISASSQQRAWSSARNFKQIHSPCENFSIYLLSNKWAL